MLCVGGVGGLGDAPPNRYMYMYIHVFLRLCIHVHVHVCLLVQGNKDADSWLCYCDMHLAVTCCDMHLVHLLHLDTLVIGTSPATAKD